MKALIPIQIRMSDLDPFGHANNGTIANYFDVGRTVYFEKAFGHEIDWSKMDLIMVHGEFDFKVPIVFNDEIFCETSLERIGNKSVALYQEIRDASGNVKSVCRSVLASVDREKNVSAPVREEYRLLLEQFAKK